MTFSRSRSGTVSRPGSQGRTPGRLAEGGFRPGPRPRNGDLGRVQERGVGRGCAKIGQSSQRWRQAEMNGTQVTTIDPWSVIAPRLAAAGTVAVALIIVALHAIKPEFDPSWRFIS